MNIVLIVNCFLHFWKFWIKLIWRNCLERWQVTYLKTTIISNIVFIPKPVFFRCKRSLTIEWVKSVRLTSGRLGVRIPTATDIHVSRNNRQWHLHCQTLGIRWCLVTCTFAIYYYFIDKIGRQKRIGTYYLLAAGDF